MYIRVYIDKAIALPFLLETKWVALKKWFDCSKLARRMVLWSPWSSMHFYNGPAFLPFDGEEFQCHWVWSERDATPWKSNELSPSPYKLFVLVGR